MWFRLGFQNFIAKKVVNDDRCDVFVSDFIRIWHKSLSNDELLSISQNLNPLFETSVQKFREMTLNLFDENEKVEKKLNEDDSDVILKLESSQMGLKFHFQVKLKEGDRVMLYKELTLPLLLMIAQMQNREKKLIKTIKDKDAEIKEYQQEHSLIKTYYAATRPFSEKDFDCEESSNPSLANIVCNPSAFLDFVDKKLLLIGKQLKVKEEKEEQSPSSNSEEQNKINISMCNKKESISNKSSGCKPSIKLSHQIIKKRKKGNESFKIKF